MTARVRLRAVAVVALSWGVLWAIVGAGLGLYAMIRESDTLDFLVFLAGVLGMCGTISGTAVAALLRRRRLSGGEHPSVARSAMLGAVSAGSVALVFIAPFIPITYTLAFTRTIAIAAALGSVSAVALAGVTRWALTPSVGSDPRAT